MFSNSIAERNIRINIFSRLADNHLYLLVGTLLVTLYFTQLILSLRWEWLAQVQSGEFYRQFTGFLLLAYVLMQGRLGLRRFHQSATNYRVMLVQHKLYGVLGPVIFYIHSIEIGFAYQVVLTFVFLGNSIVGFLNPKTLRIRQRWYATSWTILHIGLAILTLMLMFFHIYIVYYYS